MTTRPALHIKSVSKRYGDRLVLDDVSLSALPGHITTILGASGAGKSTLLRLIAGLERPTAGSIQSGDRRLSDFQKAIAPEKRNIGLIFQDFALFPNMTLLENVKFGLKSGTKTEKAHCANTWIEALGMAHRAEAYPHQVSGGEQQRIAIARALAANPDAIMMDEPFSGLDPETRGTVREIALNAIKDANIPAIMVTHDPSEALAYSDLIAVLEAGKIVQTGTPEEIFLSPKNKSVAQAFGSLHSITLTDLPKAWQVLLPNDSATLYYRDAAFLAADTAQSTSVEILKIRRTGSLHQIIGKLPSGASLTASIMLTSDQKLGQTLNLIPLPHLFYSF